MGMQLPCTKRNSSRIECLKMYSFETFLICLYEMKIAISYNLTQLAVIHMATLTVTPMDYVSQTQEISNTLSL